jgi:hypothetical protein
MLKGIIIRFGLLFPILLSACEDVIDIELNSVEPKIVIEAKLYDKFHPATVIITKTVNFFDSLNPVFISDAIIHISDNEGNEVLIPESDIKGIYQSAYFGETGKTYTLSVETEGKTYTASALMKPSLTIDSLSVKYHGAEIPYFEEGYELTCHINDSAGLNEYAIFNLFKNNEKSNEIYLFDDEYVDGLGFDHRFFADNFQSGDTAIVEMLTCDENVYEYFYTYAEITSSFYNSGGTPYNPLSNFSDDALGYFGAFSLQASEIIVEDQNK